MLTQQLIILRKDYQEIPPRVDYSLTPLGISLAEALKTLCEWGTKNEKQIEVALIKRAWK